MNTGTSLKLGASPDAPRLKPAVEVELLAMSRRAHGGNFEDFSPTFHNFPDALVWLETELKK